MVVVERFAIAKCLQLDKRLDQTTRDRINPHVKSMGPFADARTAFRTAVKWGRKQHNEHMVSKKGVVVLEPHAKGFIAHFGMLNPEFRSKLEAIKKVYGAELVLRKE